LNHLDAFAGKANALHAPVLDFGGRSARGTIPPVHTTRFGSASTGIMMAQEGIALQDGICIHNAHVRRGLPRSVRHLPHPLLLPPDSLSTTSSRGSASLRYSPHYRRARNLRDVEDSQGPQPEFLLQLLQRSIRRAVVDDNYFEFRVVQLQEVLHRYRELIFLRCGLA